MRDLTTREISHLAPRPAILQLSAIIRKLAVNSAGTLAALRLANKLIEEVKHATQLLV